MFSLLPYQEAADAGIDAAFSAGHRMVLVQMPTGTGKTILYLFLARRLFLADTRPEKKRWKTLVLAHRKELIDQPIDKLPLIWPEAEYGVVRGERDGWYAKHVVFASVATASRPNRLERLARVDFDLIVVDEAHHAAAETYMAILAAFPRARVVGLTATPGRHDKKTLRDAGFTAFAYRMHINDAVRYGYLAPFTVKRHTIKDLDLRGVKEVDGDLDQKEVSKRAARGKIVAKAVVDIYKTQCLGRRAAVFTPSAEVAKQCVEEGLAAGLRCAWLSDKCSDDKREATLRDFAAGRYDYLASYGILTEGWDDQRCDCAIIARFTKSKGLYVQIFGRPLRKHPEKDNALIIDCAPNFETHGIVFGGSLARRLTKAERGAEAEGLPVMDEFEKDAPDEPELGPDPRVENLIGASLEGALSLGADLKLVGGLRAHWIDCAPELFAIPLRDGAHVVMRRRDEVWVAEAGAVELVAHADMALVQGIAEEHARKAGALDLSKDDALWRSRPANDEQESSLRGLSYFYVEGITQGEAADLITAAVVRERYGGARCPTT